VLLTCPGDDVRTQTLGEQTKGLLNGSSVYIVGMMGSGKSSVAKVLGESLKYTVLDRCCSGSSRGFVVHSRPGVARAQCRFSHSHDRACPECRAKRILQTAA